MTLSAQIQEALAYIQGIEVPSEGTPWEKARAIYEKFAPLAGEKEAVFQITHEELADSEHKVRLRIYRPNDHQELPAILYFHGGWFNSGSLETHDTPLRQFANLSQAVVISVDYRLAPEHPFPAGLNDGEMALHWLLQNTQQLGINSQQIIIAGDSSGGAIAATLARKFRDLIQAQLLIYPVTDNSLKTPSWEEFQHGPLIDLKSGIQAWNWYLPDSAHHKHPDAIPLLADDLKGLPPAFIAVAEYDPLRDEALQYADMLNINDVPVQVTQYKGAIHGFFHMAALLDLPQRMMQDMIDFIKAQSL